MFYNRKKPAEVINEAEIIAENPENPEVKKEKHLEPIEDSELKKLIDSNKKLQSIISESNKRQEDILKALQELKQTDKEVHKEIEKTPVEKIIEEREKTKE